MSFQFVITTSASAPQSSSPTEPPKSQSTRYDLPGYTLPLNFTPSSKKRAETLFDNVLDPDRIEDTGSEKTLWEIFMMQMMNAITDKPEWHKKVFDENITSKWKQEIADSGRDLTPEMIDYVIDELKYNSKAFQETGIISAFDGEVVKSDTAISEELRHALKEAVRPLEEIPEDQKDYHPSSDDKVVDLVHPSLFPLVYGRSRILKDTVTGLDDFLNRSGQGETLAVPPEKDAWIGYGNYLSRGRSRTPYSRKFQWLPCDVELDDNDGCRIASYINNLRPDKHSNLYEIIQKIISQTIPLWNKTLTPLMDDPHNRINYSKVVYLPGSTPKPKQEPGESEDDYWDREWEWETSRPVKAPHVGKFRPPIVFSEDENVNLHRSFREKGLQVIVKLANIELTPEKPSYAGGSWHIEGQMNEHICASAIYYYDSENITSSTLSFRQRVRTSEISTEVSYEQGHNRWLKQVYGCSNYGPVTQDLGSVSCNEGRLITFPNILQHRVSPFELADPSKPGHRKILALFLVDPHIRITSTANIPPQRADWFEEKVNIRRDLLEKRLPPELQNMVLENLDNFPITMDEAKELRLELMGERSAISDQHNELFAEGQFSLCEH
ncbi:hypothetical protein ASPWEDRAFT_171776 [Aspergillus wentii DTO 134E9]|uniref:Uncharacterized protein n=1 Tax=Aspergillus wentii DTO 134E9 TaxID=1073089 RepID=A0A1L9RJ35_ASPWE|nr:uncharacterized protein ASPWEDRAFT_171776 [Aspergillus wentii DTO 134E9]KAI9932099.1 hypothetical protein MW887_009608 [Aspergillus wentii]OJJ34946.1 hypothetical protein ASPWEDRAFT_171776 [Aspergillus wentii DTO 134E9]